MRILGWVLLACLVVACGPSSKQVKAAQTARYTPPASGLFSDLQAAVEGEYEIAQSDPNEPALITVERWFNAEGAAESSGAGDSVNANDGGIRLAFLVKLVEGTDGVAVEVKPIVHRVRAGQTNLEEIPPGDSRMPGWVKGRVETLYLAIHKKLKDRVVAPAPAS
jgi:hypothetical protein